MDSIYLLNQKNQDEDSLFTELFSLLKKVKVLPEGMTTLAYKTQEIKEIHQHTDNAMSVLLQGLQDMGNILNSMAHNNPEAYRDLKNIGFFVTAISNLTEALYILQSDADYALRQSGEMDY